jgi:hypothetical protein
VLKTIINHRKNHHKWVVCTIPKWVVYGIVLTTLMAMALAMTLLDASYIRVCAILKLNPGSYMNKHLDGEQSQFPDAVH